MCNKLWSHQWKMSVVDGEPLMNDVPLKIPWQCNWGYKACIMYDLNVINNIIIFILFEAQVFIKENLLF